MSAIRGQTCRLKVELGNSIGGNFVIVTMPRRKALLSGLLKNAPSAPQRDFGEEPIELSLLLLLEI